MKKRSVGGGGSPKSHAGGKSAKQDAPGAKTPMAGKGRGGKKQKGMS